MTMRVATQAYPNADELIAAEALLELREVPMLPIDVKARIRELTGGSQDPKFLFEKVLFKSDVSQGQNRFLMPLKQIKNEFLTEVEEQELGTRLPREGCKKIEVKLIQPSLEVCTINLTKWAMGSNENYVLVTTWKKVVEENQLNIGTTVQLWSFRTNGELCFALVKKGQYMVYL